MASLCGRTWRCLMLRRGTREHLTKPLLGLRRRCEAITTMAIDHSFKVHFPSSSFLWFCEIVFLNAPCPCCSYLPPYFHSCMLPLCVLLTHWDADFSIRRFGIRVFSVGCWWCTIHNTRFYRSYNNDADFLSTGQA
jgi:hypothetical protein